MLEILASAAFGYAKGRAAGPSSRPGAGGFGDLVVAPVVEESIFRGMLSGSPALGLAGFVGDHLHRGVTTTRVADVALGGLLYAKAYSHYGLLGAIGAHMAHNVAVTLGRSHSKPQKRRRRR